MNALAPVFIFCPYCGESIEILVDCSVEEQEYTEDCQVCCRPIVLSVTVGAGDTPQVEARTEND